MKTKHTLAALSVAILATTGTAIADETADAPWQFAVTVPLWAPQINGNVTVLGHQQDVNVSFSQLKDHLDTSLALAMEAHKGKFGIFGNFGYMKFSGGFTGPLGGTTSADLKFLLANGGVSYQLVKTESEHPFVLAATAGIRYWYVATSLSHNGAGGTWRGGDNYDLVDPVIGLRASQYLTPKLHLDISGDGGGFNLNHNTDWTWSAAGMLTYDFAKWFSLSAGYQAVALDESNGDSGTGKHGLNLVFSGVAAALTFKF
jgi:hypothetical protein